MGRIAGVVLAAGASTRLGQPKQILVVNGETLVHAAVRAARDGGCDIVCVITGDSNTTVESAVADLHALIVHNTEWRQGLGTSIRAGVEQMADASAVVLLACDQPAVDGKIVSSLIDLHHQSGRPIVASRYAGTVGIPALFHRSCFAEFRNLADEDGAKGLIAADPSRVAYLEFPDGALDLDLPADVEAWRKK
jgi:molybdenum cofactor cytidylyltransferase